MRKPCVFIAIPTIRCLLHIYLIIVIIVLQVQFTSTNFSGSESSGEVLVTLALSGVSTNDINVLIYLNGIIATGHLFIN